MYGVLVWVGFCLFFKKHFLSVFTTLFYHGLQVCSVVQTIVFSTSGGLLVSVKWKRYHIWIKWTVWSRKLKWIHWQLQMTCQAILFCPLKQRICNSEILKNTRHCWVTKWLHIYVSGSHNFICCFYLCIFFFLLPSNYVSYWKHSVSSFWAELFSCAVLSSSLSFIPLSLSLG